MRGSDKKMEKREKKKGRESWIVRLGEKKLRGDRGPAQSGRVGARPFHDLLVGHDIILLE